MNKNFPKKKHRKIKYYIKKSIAILLWTILAISAGCYAGMVNNVLGPHAAISVSNDDQYVMTFVGDSLTYGALNQTMTGLSEQFPNSRIVFVTPLKRIRDGSSDMLNYNGNTLEEFAKYWVDGLHPKTAGHKIIARRLYEELFSMGVTLSSQHQ